MQGVIMAKTVLEKEIARYKRAEARFVRRNQNKEPTKLDKFLEEKIPDKLESTLNAAFAKAFHLIFSKGSWLIEKTFSTDRLVLEFELDNAQLEDTGRGRDMRKFKKRAAVTGTAHTMISGLTGITLGIMGAWMPDIVIFLSLVIRNIYQIAMRYGYDYTSDDEKKFMLRVIATAVLEGDELLKANKELNKLIRFGLFTDESTVDMRINDAAYALSRALLYMKFLQNIPVVGVIGGASDFIYMEKISDYAVLKYQRRFLMDQLRNSY